MFEMTESLQFWTLLSLVVYFIGVLFSFGCTMAFLSRYILKYNRSRRNIADMYFVTFCTSLFSWASMPTLLMYTSSVEYGWKLWHGERKSSSNKWYQKIKEDRERKLVNEYKGFKKRFGMTSAAGDCYSIWE